MARIRVTLRLVMIFAMAFVALGGSQGSAQRPGTGTASGTDSYVSELTDLEITFSDDWELDNSDVQTDQELVQLISDAGLLWVGFGEGDDVETFRDDALDGLEADAADFTLIDEDTSRGFSWALADAELEDGTAVQVYLEVDDSLSEDYLFFTMLYADPADFVDQYELANDTVEVDGGAVLNEFDVDEIDEMIGGATAADDTSVDDASTPDADGNVTETGNDDSTATDGASDSYTFELQDLELTVTDDIEINDVQLEEGSYEQVLLVGMGSIGAVSLIESPLDAADTLDGFMSGFISEMEDGTEIDSGEDNGVAWTVYEATIGGSEMYVYATVDDSRFEDVHYLELIAAPVGTFEDEFTTFQDAVQINGDDMFAGIDIDDLLGIIGAP
jgi:hypothetical protein